MNTVWRGVSEDEDEGSKDDMNDDAHDEVKHDASNLKKMELWRRSTASICLREEQHRILSDKNL
jgi:hypothetical protein